MSDGIPSELKDYEQWGRWTYNKRKNKIPLQKCGEAAKSNDPTTWCHFQQIRNFEKRAFFLHENDPFCGIDLDNCFTNQGELKEWAAEIQEKFRGVGYAEVSPSGKGLKIITAAKKPGKTVCVHRFGGEKEQLECYDKSRFWTITANVQGGFETIGDGQAAVDWLASKYLMKEPLERQRIAKPSGKVRFDELEKAAENYVQKADPAKKGGRNKQAFSLAGKLHAFICEGRRLSEDQIVELVLEWNQRNSDLLSESEIRKAVKSGLENGTPRPDKAVEPWRFKAEESTKHVEESTQQAKEPFFLYECGRTETALARVRRCCGARITYSQSIPYSRD